VCSGRDGSMMIAVVKELSSCLMSLWRKLTYNFAEDIHTPSKLNNRNTSAGKMAYEFMVGVIYVYEMHNTKL